MKAIFRPVGEQLARLRANCGLDHYTIDGPIEEGIVVIEPDLVAVRMRERGFTHKAEAVELLLRIPSGVPQSHVVVVFVEEGV